MAFFQTGSAIGVNLGNSDGATAKFALGTRVSGSNDTEWVYVRANVALTTGHVLKVNTSFSAALSNGSLLGKELAFAQGTFSASDYGFVAKRGVAIYAKFTAAATAGVQLYLNNPGSGVLRQTAATATLKGVSLITTQTAATRRALLVYATWPRVVNLTG